VAFRPVYAVRLVFMHKFIKIAAIFLLFLTVTGFTECYKPVTDTGLPKRIKTIAVPPFQFEARALRYRLESRFTDAVVREVVRRGRGLRVQGTRENADAVIEGSLRDFSFSGVLLDPTGRARVFEITIVGTVTVRDTQENKILYDNQNFVFRDSFEFASDPRTFFNEEDPAVERIARAFSESVVSAIVNGLGVKEEKK
jgi:hypothetical protein